jgi:hypothetical protein
MLYKEVVLRTTREDVMLIFKLAALVELVILENSGYAPLKTRLPLGGGHIQQLGLVFATAYVIT